MNGLCRSAIALLALNLLVALPGCASHKPTGPFEAGWTKSDLRDLNPPKFQPQLAAMCVPPKTWRPQPLKVDANHVHQVWLSLTGDTAYGVIYFKLPLPVGASLALGGFLSQMKKTEGDCTLLDRRDDPQLPGIRFVASGGLYTIHANLLVHGWEGWAIYAGTERGKPIRADELDIASRAREHTIVGRPENSGTLD